MFIINSLLISTALLASDIAIEQVLPDTAIACVTVKNAQHLKNTMEQSGICQSICSALCDGENASQCFISYLNSEEFAQFSGLDDDKFPSLPDGNAGFGVYPIIDFETGAVGVGMLAILDISNSEWSSVLKTSIENITEQEKFESELVNLVGRDVWMISQRGKIINQAVDAIGEYGIEIAGLDRMYLHVSEENFVACTEPDGMATFFNTVDGDNIEDLLSESDNYISLTHRLQTEGDIQAVLMLDNLSDTMMQMDESGMMMMVLPMAKSIIGDIDGIAETVHLVPNDDTLCDVEYTVWMGNGRNGLMGVIGDEPIDASIPGYVGPDTLSFSQVRVDLNQIVPLFKTVLQENPLLGMQFGPQIELMIASIQQALEPLGDELIFVSTGNLPVSSSSLGYLTAIECTDEQACNDYLTSVLPAIGAVPSDFLGYQMFTTDAGPMLTMPVDLSFSFATAGGYLFIGSSHSVEKALRTIANPKEAYTDHGSNGAASDLQRGEIAGWGYADPERMMEIQNLVSLEMTNDMFDEMEAFDSEMAAEFRKEFEEEQESQRQYIEIFSNFFGPAAWNFAVDEFGFNSKAKLLNSN